VVIKFQPWGGPPPLYDVGCIGIGATRRIARYFANFGVDLTASFMARRGNDRRIARASLAGSKQIVLASFSGIV
jgi:hypothetical protein